MVLGERHSGLARTDRLVALLQLDILIPDHSTLSRRSKQLDRLHIRSEAPGGPIHILVDSTGLKVHRERECVGPPGNRRTWRKLHLAVDAVTGEVLASQVTTDQTHDSSQVPGLLNQIHGEIASMMADGAYDAMPVYKAVNEHSCGQRAKIVIPPRRNAKVSRVCDGLTGQRDHSVLAIRTMGRRRWQRESGYNQRSLVESAISRYKRIIGRRLRNRTLASQRSEVKIACAIMNTMTLVGMPDSYCAA